MKKDSEISRFHSLLDSKGHLLSQEELLIEDKARALLASLGYSGAFERLAKQTFRLGDSFVYLKIKKEALENVLLCKHSVRIERKRGLKEYRD